MLKRIIIFIAAMSINNAYSGTEGEYSKDNAVASIKSSGKIVEFSIGSSIDMHMCEISGTAVMIDVNRAAYTSNDPEDKCTVLLTLGGEILKVTTNSCESYCGMGAIGSMDGLYRNKIVKPSSSTVDSGTAPIPAPFTSDAAGRISRHFTPEVNDQMAAELNAAGRGTLKADEIYGRYVAWMFNQEGYSADLTIRAFISGKEAGYGSAILAKETGLDIIIAAILNRVPESVNAYIRSGVVSEETLGRNVKRSQTPADQILVIPPLVGWKGIPGPLSTSRINITSVLGSDLEEYNGYILTTPNSGIVYILGRSEDFDEKTLNLFSQVKDERAVIKISATFNEHEDVIAYGDHLTYFADRSQSIYIAFPKPLKSY
jgi:hypothetical protein